MGISTENYEQNTKKWQELPVILRCIITKQSKNNEKTLTPHGAWNVERNKF